MQCIVQTISARYLSLCRGGGAENVGRENDGHEIIDDQLAGHETAGHENAGQKSAAYETSFRNGERLRLKD